MLWATLPVELHERVLKFFFASVMNKEVVPMKMVNLAQVDRFFASQPSWADVILRAHCRHLLDCKLGGSDFVRQLTRILIANARRTTNPIFPWREYHAILAYVRPWNDKGQLISSRIFEHRSALGDKFDPAWLEINVSVLPSFDFPQPIAPLLIHEAGLTEEQKNRVIGRLTRVFHQLNKPHEKMVTNPNQHLPGEDKEIRVVVCPDTIKRGLEGHVQLMSRLESARGNVKDT